jgi:hypothetical protein
MEARGESVRLDASLLYSAAEHTGKTSGGHLLTLCHPLACVDTVWSIDKPYPSLADNMSHCLIFCQKNGFHLWQSRLGDHPMAL